MTETEESNYFDYKSKPRDAQQVREDRAVQPDSSTRPSGLTPEGEEKHHAKLSVFIRRIESRYARYSTENRCCASRACDSSTEEP